MAERASAGDRVWLATITRNDNKDGFQWKLVKLLEDQQQRIEELEARLAKLEGAP